MKTKTKTFDTKAEKTANQLLDNAVDLLYNMFSDDDIFCCKLLEIPEEERICSEQCENLNKDCILRYLKYYEKDV